MASNARPDPADAGPQILPALDDPALYISRELSQLEFNARVLEQARDPGTPLLERLRFLCISCTNLDEFFEIRFAAVVRALEQELPPAPHGLPPAQLIERIHQRAQALVQAQYRCWNQELRPQLAAAGVRVLTPADWTAEEHDWLRQHFIDEILPVLSPLGLDPALPFPRILNKSLNVLVALQGGTDDTGPRLAVVRAPRSLPRLIELPEQVTGNPHSFVLLSTLLSSFAGMAFPGTPVRGAWQFRITRNAELLLDEEEVEDIVQALEDELRTRGFARAMRLEIANDCPTAVVEILLEYLELPHQAVYRIDGSVNLHRVVGVHARVKRADLHYPPFTPRLPPALAGPEIFATIRSADVLLHHPFDAFDPVVELVRAASTDPDVLAIRQTLYRSARNGELIDHLITAARNGKDVTAVIELRARFDEARNLHLADRMQEAGIQVTYGVVGRKTHAKMLLVLRREEGGLCRYAHLSTGNYHAVTARQYTDLGLLTANPDICADVDELFRQVPGLTPPVPLRHLLQSPLILHRALLERIEREARLAQHGRPARIIAKLNALDEPQVIQALYRASRAGVSIDLIVRGACALRPGVPGVSDNIRVRSIVGRFLEHTRIYWFSNDGAAELFCSSADWLERNLLRRIEVCFPILDPNLARRVFEDGLRNYLADNTQAWLMQADGSYRLARPGPGEAPHSAQTALLPDPPQ